MRKAKILQIVAPVIASVVEHGLPDDVKSFPELVQQYGARVLPDLTVEEVNEFMSRPLSELFPECSQGRQS